MYTSIIALTLVVSAAAVSVGLCRFLVQRDFFLPHSLLRRIRIGRQILAATWVLAVAGTVVLLCIAAVWLGVNAGPSLLKLMSGGDLQSLGSFRLMGLWEHMGWLARAVAIVLFIESIWSLAVMIDRYLYFSAARKQTREFAPKFAGALKNSRLEEAIKIADRSKKSHLAEVVTAGLQEFQASAGQGTEASIESSQRALERAEAIVHARLKRGLSVLATVGATAPFVGLFGTVVGILSAFELIASQKTTNSSLLASDISKALITTGLSLLVAFPAAWAFKYFGKRLNALDREMHISARELIGTLRTVGSRNAE